MISNKHLALKAFTTKILDNPIASSVAGIYLFGSVARGEEDEGSDIDLIVIGTDRLRTIQELCHEISFDLAIEYKESIEPLVYCIEEYRHPPSYFLYSATRYGKEIYQMEREELKKKEAFNLLELAKEYLRSAEVNLHEGQYRACVDLSYNSAELVVKGLILLKQDILPQSHGGVVGRFGEIYVKTGILPPHLGRNLNNSLEQRNKARYDWHAEIDKDKAQKVINLAQELIEILEKASGEA
ncbi:MAG: HEPN domain-containing protein [bacterium]